MYMHVVVGFSYESEALMNCHSPVHVAILLGLGLAVGLAGCSRAPSEAPAAAPAPVAVSRPLERYVTDYADFTARTAAVDSGEVRAHVWGYLAHVHFKA